MLELNKLYNMDCMEGMAQFPDKYFDLAIVDPPYGIDRANNTKKISKHKGRKNSYIKRGDYSGKKWDTHSPNDDYFNELFRISVEQIIWGANHFISKICRDSSCWIIWDKVEALETYSSGEMAWTSFNKPMKIVHLIHSGFKRGITTGKLSKVKYNKPFSGAMDIHPTQKPPELYKWLLKNYAKPDFKILDTHAGSCSSVIAFLDFGCDWIAFEIDKDYYEAASKRIKIHKQQLRLNYGKVAKQI